MFMKLRIYMTMDEKRGSDKWSVIETEYVKQFVSLIYQDQLLSRQYWDVI